MIKNPSYYVAMQDYGRGIGIGAEVDMEFTRRDIVKRIASGEWSHICFVHHIHGLSVDDVTDDIMEEVERINARKMEAA